MGGVKNRDEKRKAAKVFASGGGGGTKGPATVDKRGQELQCPHCDRTFKQSGRLQDHIKKQHANETESNVQQQPNVDNSSNKNNATKKMMDVGSRGGYFDVKSPRLILHEWLLREKKPKARFKALLAPDGVSWTCKVVLPHERQSEKDIVVFLQDKYAATDEEDAKQRGAVAALHRIAGDRALERVLPGQYRTLWQELGVAATQREERKLKAASEAARRATKLKERRLREGKVTTVIMTEEKRLLVESLLSELRLERSSADVDIDFESIGMESMESSALIQRLSSWGFEEEDVMRAVATVQATHETEKGQTLETLVLDWLCLNIPEARLPGAFAPGASGNPVKVVRSSQAHRGEISENGQQQDLFPELARYGYACRPEGDDEDTLFESLWKLWVKVLVDAGWKEEFEEGTPAEAPPTAGIGMQEPGLDWEEERIALEAIYGPERIDFRDPLWTTVTFESVGLPGVVLEVWAPRHKPGRQEYPLAPPTLAIRSDDPAHRQGVAVLTRQLADVVIQSLGRPMLHDVISHIEENFPNCIRQAMDLPPPPPSSSLQMAVPSATVSQTPQAMQHNDAEQRGRLRPVNRAQVKVKVELETQQRHLEFLEQESRRLLQHYQALVTKNSSSLVAARQKLPAYKERDQVIRAVRQSRVVVISGATGCGKSTQVPQFILEDAILSGQGGSCNIIVTQPRRISAVGLATRVAAERGESVGDVVGYSVRLDSKRSKRTRVLFCTTRILLRMLMQSHTGSLDEGDGATTVLKGTTHVILDEVHERSMESDLLLLLLRRFVASNPVQTSPSLKVVLMSATADADLFVNYFSSEVSRVSGPVTKLSIPGFTYPVKDLYLEDCLEETGFVVGKTSKWAVKGIKGTDKGTDKGMDKGMDTELGGGLVHHQYSLQTRRSLSFIDESLVNVDLIHALVNHVASKSSEKGPSGILVFLPGIEDISRVVKALQMGEGAQRLRVLPLHGGLPASQQSRVFESVPPSVVKVVVSTNVAETSITIDDITTVIDTGRAKELRHDPVRGMACLQETWISQASAQQRRGRAGRVRPGQCYRLFSRSTWESLAKDTLPEVCRAPLEPLVMDIKGSVVTQNRNTEQLLGEMLTPPDLPAIGTAVKSLTLIGALEESNLTPLGRHLVRMPCDPRVGKMLIFAAMLHCVDPILTIAAALGHGRPVWKAEWGEEARQQAEAAKAALISSVAASKSDHLAIVAAYDAWRNAFGEGGAQGRKAAREMCFTHSLSDQTMEAIHLGRRQYADILADLGFVPSWYPDGITLTKRSGTGSGTGSGRGSRGGPEGNTPLPDQMSHNARIIKAVLAAGLYPQLLRVEHPATKYQKVLGGAIETDGEAAKVKFYHRDHGRTFIHPSSMNFRCGRFETGWLVYSELVKTSKVFVRDVTMVPAYGVLLFGGNIDVHHEQGLVIVDGWAKFKAPARIAVLIRELRTQVSMVLSQKIADPTVDLSQSPVVAAIHRVLSTDGF